MMAGVPARYAIRHVTRFAYEAAVSESVMELRMQPATGGQQQCLQFSVEVHPRARVFAYRDFFDNWVHHFTLPRRHRQLAIEARSDVEVAPLPPLPPALAIDQWDEVDRWATQCEHWDYRQPSHFAHGSDSLAAFLTSAEIADRSHDPLTMTERIMAAIHQRFEYAPRSTRVDSTVDDAVATGRGVCQDFAHLMIAALRRLALPARYISGYIAPDDFSHPSPTSIATHAWVEVYLPQLGWIGFDPTHNVSAGTRHVRVAAGRDYADVPPTRGVFKGTAAGTLDVAVEIASGNEPASTDASAGGDGMRARAEVSGLDERRGHKQEQQQQQQQ